MAHANRARPGLGRTLGALAVAMTMAALATPAQAALDLTTSNVVDLVPQATPDGYTSTGAVSFTVTETSDAYVKLLTTPGNPVHDGTRANGSVESDASGGISGWWVRYAMNDDAGGAPDDLGHFADGTPTKNIALATETTYTLTVTVHAPPDAARGTGFETVYVALGFAAATESTGSSGASLDNARTLKFLVRWDRVGETHAAAADAPAGAGAGDDPGTGGAREVTVRGPSFRLDPSDQVSTLFLLVLVALLVLAGWNHRLLRRMDARLARLEDETTDDLDRDTDASTAAPRSGAAEET